LSAGTEGNHGSLVKDIWFPDPELKPWHPEHKARGHQRDHQIKSFFPVVLCWPKISPLTLNEEY